MKKNLLTMVLVFSFAFFGLLLTEASASSGLARNVKASQNLSFGKSMNRSEFLSKMKKRCVMLDCEGYLILSAAAFDNMIAACDYAEESWGCWFAQVLLEIQTIATLEHCSAPYVSKAIKKEDSLPDLDRANRLSKVKTSGS